MVLRQTLTATLFAGALTPVFAGDVQVEQLQRSVTSLFSIAGTAAEDALAKFHSGQRHYYGSGVPQSFQEAARHFRIAAERGLPEAQYELSRMHLAGLGVPRDYMEAFHWSRLASARGNTRTMRILAGLFAHGVGVPRSLVMSYALQHLIEDFDPGSRMETTGYRTELAKLMSTTDIRAAGDLAAQMGMPGNFLPVFDQFVGALKAP